LLGVTKNYMDRQVLGVLKTTLQHDLGWNEIQYANLVTTFQGAYALGMLAVGWLVDRLGARLGYALSMIFWSLAAMAHAGCSSVPSFMLARSALGFWEAGVFPASIKAVADWFPSKERALATGIFNAGTSAGAMATPLLVPWITLRWGWRWAFVSTGALGVVWLALWLTFYRKPEEESHVSQEELAYIRSDGQETPPALRWSQLLPLRQTWAFVVGKFMLDPIWWFYLFWVPDFLQRRHGLELAKIGLPLVTVYLISDVGSIGGGWISSTLIHRGSSVNLARKLAMLICSLTVVPIVFAYHAQNLWIAVVLIGMAAAGHQGFSANLFTMTSDLFPTQAVASVVGIGGMAGAVGGMFIAKLVGYILQRSGSYQIPFFIAGCSYLVALGAIHLLTPGLGPAQFPADDCLE
jgi:ACS family hexuronate transporter-like MFS transporter